MNEPRPGSVQCLGLLEGPTAAWSPSAEQLRDALRRAGAPEDLLHLLVEGGRSLLEATPLCYPRGQFASDPEQALGLALRFLLEEGPGGPPSEWFCTLRVVEYRNGQKRETLLSLGPEGVRAVSRESAWTPPRPRIWTRLRTQWPLLLLVLAAAGLGAWMMRDPLRARWERLRGHLGLETLEVDPGALQPSPFDAWLDCELASVEEGRLTVRCSPRTGFPATAEEIDALRERADLDQRAALNALEAGRAQLHVELEGGGEALVPLDLKPLRDGRSSSAAWSGSGKVRRLSLEP